jgi:protein-disulfide isomerase
MKKTRFPLWLALAASGATSVAMGQSPDAQQCTTASAARHTPDNIVAVVAGEPISAHELDAAAASQIMQLRNQEYQIKSRVLNALIRRRAVEVEARKQGLTVEQLYAKEIDGRIPNPRDAEVYAYYLGIKSQLNKSFQEIKVQLQTNLKNLEVKEMREDYADFLRGKAEISVLLQAPRVEVAFDRERLRGDSKAPVTIVEFADYQCPFCQKTESAMKELLKKYPGQVNLAFRDFPLTAIHPNAQKASEAARCAGKQGKFWEFHDALFADEARLDEPGLKEAARTLGLDEKAFASCLASAEFASQVALDQEDGKKAGVGSTPSFFVNGVFISGVQPVSEFEKLIDNELKSATDQTGVRAAR